MLYLSTYSPLSVNVQVCFARRAARDHLSMHYLHVLQMTRVCLRRLQMWRATSAWQPNVASFTSGKLLFPAVNSCENHSYRDASKAAEEISIRKPVRVGERARVRYGGINAVLIKLSLICLCLLRNNMADTSDFQILTADIHHVYGVRNPHSIWSLDYNRTAWPITARMTMFTACDNILDNKLWPL